MNCFNIVTENQLYKEEKLHSHEMAFAIWFESELCGQNNYNETIADFFHLVIHFANCYVLKVHKYRFIYSQEETIKTGGPYFPLIHEYLSQSNRGHPEKFLDGAFIPAFQGIVSICKNYEFQQLLDSCECKSFQKSSYDKWTLRNEFACSQFEKDLFLQFQKSENENIQKYLSEQKADIILPKRFILSSS